MKKVIVIIQSENGGHKSSIIRAISQILIGLNKKTVFNLGELGLSENIASIIHIDQLKIGIASQNNLDDNSLEMISQLIDKECDVILGVIQNDPVNFEDIEKFGERHSYRVRSMRSNWSEKLEVNYLTEEQVKLIVKEITLIQDLNPT